VVKVNDIPGDSWNLLEKIQRYNYIQPPWSTAYPLLAAILDEGDDQAKEPKGCIIRKNIGWQNTRWLEESCWGGCGGFGFYTIEDNFQNQDPLFVDEAALDLRLQLDSPAYTLPGFQPIPFEHIGLLKTGDLNADNEVNLRDFAWMAHRWNSSSADTMGDISPQGGDGLVNQSDLHALIQYWLW